MFIIIAPVRHVNINMPILSATIYATSGSRGVGRTRPPPPLTAADL